MVVYAFLGTVLFRLSPAAVFKLYFTNNRRRKNVAFSGPETVGQDAASYLRIMCSRLPCVLCRSRL